jgi:hypothetical protein
MGYELQSDDDSYLDGVLDALHIDHMVPEQLLQGWFEG